MIAVKLSGNLHNVDGGAARGGDVWRRKATFIRPGESVGRRGARHQTGGASLCCITATNRHGDNVKKKKRLIMKKSEEERQNPGFLSLITPRDANGITKSSTSPASVLAKNRCTHYYSRKPIRAAAGQESRNTGSTRWRLSDPRSQLWKFLMTSDDNSTVCTVCFLVLIGANPFSTMDSIQTLTQTVALFALHEHDARSLQFFHTFQLSFYFSFWSCLQATSLSAAPDTRTLGRFVTCHNYCCWSGVILWFQNPDTSQRGYNCTRSGFSQLY